MAAGESVFASDTVVLDLADQESEISPKLCCRAVMAEMSEALFRQTDYMDRLSASVKFNRAKHNVLVEEFASEEKARYENAGFAHPAICLHVLRAWLLLLGASAENWLWTKATIVGEWLKIPWREALAAAKYFQEGKAKRYVPSNHQVLPCITKCRIDPGVARRMGRQLHGSAQDRCRDPGCVYLREAGR
jgi:hypothetical protein